MLNVKNSLFLLLAVIFCKLLALFFFLYYGHEIFGGGNDSNYYHAYALYEKDVAVNLWPIILRYFNDLGLYNREILSCFLMLLGFIVIPYMAASLCECKAYKRQKTIFYFVFLLLNIYPTLFYYTLDIYRDVFMVFVFLLCVYVVKYHALTKRAWKRLFLTLLVLGLSYALFLLRPYLGAAVLLSFLTYGFVPSLIKKYLLASFIVFLLTLNFLFAVGALDPIMQYREIFFEIAKGGANLGVSFSSNFMFIPDFIISTAYQLFGLFFINFPAIIVFFIESVPFIIGVCYLLKNIKYSIPLVWFLLVFTITYSTVFIIGNDNLGTAVRLRMYSYISVLISCMIIYQRKKMCAHLVSR